MILVFVAFIIPGSIRTNMQDSSGVLKSLLFNDDFRHCVVNYNISCVNSSIASYIPREYLSNYVVIVTKDYQQMPTGIPTAKTINENIYIATDGDVHNEYIVRLYYWQD